MRRLKEIWSLSNCFFYAFNRWRKEGGYFVIRRSHTGWWLHFEFTLDRVTFSQYGPEDPVEGILSPPMFYHGVITHGVGPEIRRRTKPTGKM